MTNPKLKSALRPIIRQYGLGTVIKSLGEMIADSDFSQRSIASLESLSVPDVPEKVRRGTPNSKVTATEYVSKLELPPEKKHVLGVLAERFERKKFMHSFGDIDNFCQIHRIDVPKSRSRAGAIPRIFKFLAGMEMTDIQRMLDYEMFSGPAQVAPIADAIRRNGRASRATNHTPASERASSRMRRTSSGDSASA